LIQTFNKASHTDIEYQLSFIQQYNLFQSTRKLNSLACLSL
jgi:hypothetical protein